MKLPDLIMMTLFHVIIGVVIGTIVGPLVLLLPAITFENMSLDLLRLLAKIGMVLGGITGLLISMEIHGDEK